MFTRKTLFSNKCSNRREKKERKLIEDLKRMKTKKPKKKAGIITDSYSIHRSILQWGM